MALSNEQQAIELLTRAKRVLIVTRQHAPTDAIASVASTYAFLKKMNKQCDAVAPDYDATMAPKFISGADQIKGTMGAVRAFELSLDVTQNKLNDISYDIKDNKLVVTVVPETGEWSPKDVAFRHGEDRYDLIVALDCQDLQSLGSLFAKHADFFYRTPVINIDRDPGNEHWGHLNLVDLTAVATTEILYGLFARWNRNLIDENLSTSLLAGMISKTQSFRTQNVTPKTLQVAAELIANGARREEIVQGLWRTRTVPTLKLWGTALSRLESDRDHNLVWTTLTRQDFVSAGVSDTALDGIVEELVNYAPEAKVVVIVYEKESSHITGACVAIHVSPPYSAVELGRPFGATGTKNKIEFCLVPGTPLVQGVKEVVEKLKGVIRAVKM
jgi:phosphoesterase RecJ-like protein